jgi:hypothetical protein
MEHTDVMQYPAVISSVINDSEERTFLASNTVGTTLYELKNYHTIPMFVKDREPVISQYDFINAMIEIAQEVYSDEMIAQPTIRVSHQILGRIPEAKDKPVSQLLESEKTLYYERMAFTVEIPSITDLVDGNELRLTFGGVKSYAADNLYNKKGADEHFKIFIGFKNMVCTNMTVWSSGLVDDLKVRSIGELKACMRTLLLNYNSGYHLYHLKQLANYTINESQFAHLIGRCRLYQHVPNGLKQGIPSLLFGDNQISNVCKEYYRDENFARDSNGDINLWKLYNLFTGANKMSYVDTFLERSVNAFDFVEAVKTALKEDSHNWYLS